MKLASLCMLFAAFEHREITMSNIQMITAVLTLLAGIGVFLVACSMLSKNLETLGSSKLRELFASASKSKLLGVGIGALGTAAIQSSGATTVIAIGFVNAGIMTLAQAAAVIYGANIGTTITGQIVAWGISGDGGISTTIIFSAITGIGAFIMAFATSDRVKNIGGILTGFGLLFVGLGTMSGAMESFSELESMRVFLASIGNVFLLVLIGAVLTAIIQSSSVMTSIAITMVVAGLITLDQGIYLTMGSNIGSCVVALIAGATGTTSAKRASLIHLIFNVSGVVIFMIVGFVISMASGNAVGFGTIFGNLFPGMPQIQLAMFHTVFNVVAVIIMLPFTDLLVSAVTHLVPDLAVEEPEGKIAPQTHFIDESLLVTPSIAVQQTKNEIVGMAGVAMDNFKSAIVIARTLDFSERAEFERNEEQLNFLNRELARYIAKLFGEQLSEKDRGYLSHALHTISDLERVGDYSANIIGYAGKLVEEGLDFSSDAKAELEALQEMVERLYSDVMHAYIDEDPKMIENAKAIEGAINIMGGEMSRGHIDRMTDGRCTPEVGAHYLALISDVERISAHLYNLAKATRGLKP
mgnify:CR=1 FL=1